MFEEISLTKELDQFSGTERYYRYLNHCLLTDGTKFLAEKAKAYWLMDIIASHQPRKEEFQIWTLEVFEGKKAVVEMFEDVNEKGEPVKVLIKQELEYTDFPLSEVKIYCQQGSEGNVIFLPSEY